jgi:hypothetical protein
MPIEIKKLTIDADLPPEEVLEQFINATMVFCNATNTNMMSIETGFSAICDRIKYLSNTIDRHIQHTEALFVDIERRLHQIEVGEHTIKSTRDTYN